jgi:hypothetical protein
MGTRERVLGVLACVPMLAAILLLRSVEPFPQDWLYRSNPHFWANLLRAITLFVGGGIIGLATYTMLKSIRAEDTVTGGHPRKQLYRHVTLIAAGHGLLMVSTLFYIRERINFPLSPATPVVLIGLGLTVWALRQMLGYQNSRLRTFHAAKQVIAVIEPSASPHQHLCIRAVGSMEAMSIEEWVGGFEGGALVRMTIERVEEIGEPKVPWRTRIARRLGIGA